MQMHREGEWEEGGSGGTEDPVVGSGSARTQAERRDEGAENRAEHQQVPEQL